ncbi:DUF3291 domain-containing protein [Luedemannella helvata]|uniref:DUF3291 domain-containing protein n=1 Tax=Luedemannella helvata TaxID=349315 RepID=A0ABP4W1K7_9ACTN
MSDVSYHLAQINIARLLAPLDDPLLADFVANLDAVNAAAEASPGYVWRLDEPAGAVCVFDDDWLIVNMSVWTSVGALTSYVYSAEHRAVLARRREWFARLADATTVLWWVPAGHLPDVAEGERKLRALRADGPTPAAFTLRATFPPPTGPASQAQTPDVEPCTA